MEEYLKLLPEEIVGKITLYNSHPVADLFKNELEEALYCHFSEVERFEKEDDFSLEDHIMFASGYLHHLKMYKEMHDSDTDSDIPFDDGRCPECSDFRELGDCPYCGRCQW